MIRKNINLLRFTVSLCLCAGLTALPLGINFVNAEEEPVQVSEHPMTSKECVHRAWEASGRGDLKVLDDLVKKCFEVYGGKANELQSQLTSFPQRGEEDTYQILNDVATCLFIRAEAYMNQGKTEEAVVLFQEIIDDYSWAEGWDPSRGSYWSIAEKSQDSLAVIQGKVPEIEEEKLPLVKRTKPILFTKGKERVVDYTQYGSFANVGTQNYQYTITDLEGLKKAVGEGVYPNLDDVYKNPRYKDVRKEKRLKGKHWDFVNSDDLEAAYFKWVTAPEPMGVRLFYIALIFEKAGMYYEALKAYHALVVHYPKTVAWTYWQTPWYPGQAAIAKIRYIIRFHPELDLDYKWMEIKVKNGFDNVVDNDVFITYPGKIFQKNLIDDVKNVLKIDHRGVLGNVKNKIGEGEVQLVQYENDHWQLLVRHKPYIIKGMTYSPTKVGQSPDKGTVTNWMEDDSNKNGLPDGPYDAYVDKNNNNIQDTDEPGVGDFQLMKEMGVNTLRIYHHPSQPNKEVLRKMFENYGLRVMMGDYLGKYTLGSGASWFEGTDYENPEHQKAMMESVKAMVLEFKDEPYLLMWVLGNENNYGVASNADKKPDAYFKFVDRVAAWIKSVDPNHPVVLTNGDTLYLDLFAKDCPHVDIFSANVYRGDYGFGSFWDQVASATGKPAFISEFGCPAYARHLTYQEAEEYQAQYHRGNWLDIEENLAGHPRGTGNALGGVVFEWLDEWWKNYEPYRHDKKSDAIGPFPGGYYFEEWFGVTGQGSGQHSPFLRHLRESYFAYKKMWNK